MTSATLQDPAAGARAVWAMDVADDGVWEFTEVDPTDPLAPTAPASYSPRLCVMLEHDAAPVVRSWLEALHPEDRPMMEEVRQRQVSSPHDIVEREYRVIVGGETRWWHERSQARPAERPDRWRLVGVVRDVTEHRQLMQRMRRHAELMRQTQAAAAVGGWEIDLVANQLYWTEETHRIHEVPPGYVPELGPAINFYAPEHVPIISEAVAGCQSGRPFDVELDLITYTGRRIHVHATGHPYYEDGALTRIYGAFRDITEARRREAELREQIDRIARQDEAIRALSTPIIQIWDNIITLPVVGALDPDRATHIMDRLLSEVSRVNARFAILDLTGVDSIDTTTADQVLRLTRAVRLLGARGLLCGVKPAIAQTLTELGVDMSSMVTYRNLQEALRGCLRALDVKQRGR